MAKDSYAPATIANAQITIYLNTFDHIWTGRLMLFVKNTKTSLLTLVHYFQVQ